MAKTTREEILKAIGPFTVTKATAPIVVGKIKFRHFKPEEMQAAKAFVKAVYIEGDYYFDWLLWTDQARFIFEKMKPLDISDVIPWMMRIDCVIRKGRAWWLIEIKDRLTSSGIGQLLAYKKLFEEQHPKFRKIILGYVVLEDNPTLHSTLKAFDIALWVVKPEKSD